MCSGAEEGSYLRLIDCVYNSTLGLRVIKKKKKTHLPPPRAIIGRRCESCQILWTAGYRGTSLIRNNPSL